jgi:hypothetical protein
MTRSDFLDWKSHPITKAFFIAINNKVELLKEELAYQAGENSRLDGTKVGAIQALRDIVEADWFEESEV